MNPGPRSAVLQNGASSGNGTVLQVADYDLLMLGMVGGAAGANRVVNFEGSQDGTNYVALMSQNRATLALATTATQDGTTAQLWVVPVAGLRTFRARLSGGTTGVVTVTATAIQGFMPGWAAPA